MGENRFHIRIPTERVPVLIQDRIKAKARLWDFLNDIRESIANWPDTEDDLANQLITSTITILLPHFNGIEIEREMRNIYTTLNMKPPEGFLSLFVQSYQNTITVKLDKLK